jgi:hypothetical protein
MAESRDFEVARISTGFERGKYTICFGRRMVVN